jgi:hypothetical protein
MDVVAGAGDANFAGEAGAEHDAPSSFFTFPRTAAETVRTSSPSSDQLGQLPVTVLNSGGTPEEPCLTSASTQAVYRRHGHGCVTKRRSLQTVGHVAAKVQPYGGGTTPGGHGKELVVVLGDRTLKTDYPIFSRSHFDAMKQITETLPELAKICEQRRGLQSTDKAVTSQEN